MKSHRNSGLVDKEIADRVAGAVFVLVIIAALIILFNAKVGNFPSTTTTVETTVQTILKSQHVEQQTKTVERTTADVVPPFWESLTGSKATSIFFLAASLFIAFLLAAVVQRVLLGKYGFSLGILTVPEITGQEVKNVADSALAGLPSEATTEATEATQEPVWATVNDPNLALAGWRIDLEKELNRIGEEVGIPVSSSRSRPLTLAQTLRSLSQNGVIAPEMAVPLQELLVLANRGVHGASVDPSVIDVLRTEGRDILRYLSSIHG